MQTTSRGDGRTTIIQILSDSDRKVGRNIYPGGVTHDGIRLIDPKSGQLGTICHYLLE